MVSFCDTSGLCSQHTPSRLEHTLSLGAMVKWLRDFVYKFPNIAHI